jgi:hypothetical protein
LSFYYIFFNTKEVACLNLEAPTDVGELGTFVHEMRGRALGAQQGEVGKHQRRHFFPAVESALGQAHLHLNTSAVRQATGWKCTKDLQIIDERLVSEWFFPFRPRNKQTDTMADNTKVALQGSLCPTPRTPRRC